MHRINDLPRNLTTFRKVTIPDPVVKVFTKEESLLLFKEAMPRMKLYVLLALNAGYTQRKRSLTSNMSRLIGEAGTIDEVRGKVKKKAAVPRKVRLWPSTLAALRLYATDPSQSELVLLTEKGRPLVWRELREGEVRVSA